MIVEWSGPFALLYATFESNGLPEAEGVYLWVLPHHGQRLVHYVGYASNIRHRQYTHIARTLGGGDWAPRFPIGEWVENRYARPSSRGARNVEYDRLKQYVDGLPGSVRLWPEAVKRFYGCPQRQRNREDIGKALGHLADTRNRVAHHHPIWDRRPDKRLTEIVEVVAWLNPGLAEAVRQTSNLPQLFAAGHAPFRPLAASLTTIGL